VARPLIALLLLAGLAMCAPGGLCPLGPFIPDDGYQTRFTAREKAETLIRLNAGAEICGWRPPAA